MQKRDRTPLRELAKYAGVAAIMCAVMLILTRGKWLTALVLGIWLFLVARRFIRYFQNRR
jgi:hypothetical protein